MKIAIITLIGEYNNGNRLQNYALQESLLKIFPDAEVNTIDLNPSNTFIRKVKKIIKLFVKRQKNIKQFKDFNKNINFTSKRYNEINENYKALIDQYDYFITGSDQVWNMGYYFNEKYYFLDWVPTEKKLSYAASIGNNTLSVERQAKFKNLLKSYNFISVREKQSEMTLKELGIENVTTNIDPTLILTQDDWSKVEKAPKNFGTKDYVFVCLLGEMTADYQEKIDLLASLYNLSIINLHKTKYKCGPSEFIHLIKNAKFVVTDSFHCIVFSIIYNISFFHFARCEKDVASSSANINSRITNLERIFKTKFMSSEDISIENKDNLTQFIIKDKDKILEEERQRSYDYLRTALSPQKSQNLNEKKFNCTGCGLCANICPQKAIKIVKNKKGFYQFSIDDKKCTKCGACVKLCPANKRYENTDFNKALIFGAKNITPIKDNSSSAGVFGKIATQFLNNASIIYGLSYNEKNEFGRITNIEELEKIKGSKYYQANISTIHPQIEKDLESNKQVLVCATPCQIAGLKQKFKKYKNLTTIAVVCHGTPSKDILNEYCQETYNEIPQNFNFRKKTPYWKNFSMELTFEKRTIVEKADCHEWFKGFLANYYLNDCCYNCNFAGKEFGADLMLGDFWGIDKIDPKFYDKYGTSIIVALTEKGKELISKIKNEIKTKQYKLNNKIISFNPCIVRTKYGKEKQYAQEIFYLNREHGMSFQDNLNTLKSTEKKQPFIKRAIKKIYRIVFRR